MDGWINMKQLEWQLILFVGSSLIHEYWIYWGLPKVYYWDAKRKYLKGIKIDNYGDHKII